MKWNTKDIQVIKKKKILKDKNKNKVDGSNGKKLARCRLKFNINNYIIYKWTKITNPKENYQTSFFKKPVIYCLPKNTLKMKTHSAIKRSSPLTQ